MPQMRKCKRMPDFLYFRHIVRAAACVCGRPTWNRKPGEMCCRSCKGNGRVHGTECEAKFKQSQATDNKLSQRIDDLITNAEITSKDQKVSNWCAPALPTSAFLEIRCYGVRDFLAFLVVGRCHGLASAAPGQAFADKGTRTRPRLGSLGPRPFLSHAVAWRRRCQPVHG